jgi:RimJ/RimL family protein N-acetyltransferase
MTARDLAVTPPADVRLRPVEQSDLVIFLAHQADPVAAAMAAFPTRAPDAFYAHWAEILADPTNVALTITADRAVVGDIVSWVEDGRREVGYWIGREAWGRGYATAALRLLLESVPDRPMYARAADHNVGSRRVLEHCGFSRVGETEADGFREGIYRLD